MARITISYRREDSGFIVGRIFDRLVSKYGAESVFRDIDNVPPGIDFRRHINGVLDHTDILLAVIGPQWAGKMPDGHTRIAEPTDWVRIEVEAALRKEIPVIPVLVANASMPTPNELPDVLHDFAYRAAIKVDALEDFDDHLRRLIRSMDDLLQSMGAQSYETAAAKGNANAMYNLATLYDDGRGVLQDKAKAREWFEKAAAEGDARAMVHLGASYANGEGVEQNYVKAREWFEKALAKGNVQAMSNIGWIYNYGLPQDYAKAREWYQEAAARGNADAMFRLGWIYSHGQGVAQDFGQARDWYEKAAAKNHENAMVNVGWLYHSGLGGSQDHAKAREWYEKAAAKGNAAAMLNLASLSKDNNEVRKWYEKAAAEGDARAMFRLGELYDNGRGVPRDHSKAREWYEKAAAKGDASAKALLERGYGTFWPLRHVIKRYWGWVVFTIAMGCLLICRHYVEGF